MEKCVYFTDQFFSFGRTDIYNESQEKVGELDLKSAFTSSMSVENEKGEIVVEGCFPFFSGKWVIKKSDGTELGMVSASFWVWIPKPGKVEKRPIGVPSVADRALQRSTSTVLSSIYEQDFLNCSYGGRPNRGHIMP
jgi:hypothetical protein